MSFHLWYLTPFWGHMGPGIALILASLAANPDLKVTLIYHACIENRLRDHLANYPPEATQRLRLEPVGNASLNIGMTMQDVGTAIGEVSQGFIGYLMMLEPKPSLVVLDQACPTALYNAARQSSPDMKIWLAFNSCPSFLCTYLGLNDRLDKHEEDETIIKYMKYRNGYEELKGVEVDIPGAPSVYDYERDDANFPTPDAMFPFVLEMLKTCFAVDGLALSASYATQQASIEQLRASLNVAVLGNLVGTRAFDGTPMKEGAVKTFLDEYGKDEAILVCFGSMHFPEEAKLSILLDSLIASKRPFVFASVKPGSLSDNLKTKVEAASNALHVEGFYDQIGVLNHASIGWFLTHGGWNSVQEAMVIGKPMIVWPLQHGDQQMLGATISTGESPIGFEFLQIRNWKGPTKRGVDVKATPEAMREDFDTVLQQAYGAAGQQRRANVLELSKNIRAEHETKDAEVIKEFAMM